MIKSIFASKIILWKKTNQVKVILTTDSELLNERLQKILCEITSIEIVAIGKNMDETFNLIKDFDPDALIISFNRITKDVFEKLRKIKNNFPQIAVVVLSSFPFLQYRIQWKEAGADYVFDQAMQFSKMIDALCSLLYKRKFESMLKNKSVKNDLNHDSNKI